MRKRASRTKKTEKRSNQTTRSGEDTKMIYWTKTVNELLNILQNEAPKGYEVIQDKGFVFWVPENWEGGIALCAHVDTVWHETPVLKKNKKGIISSAVVGRGIGADDRVGVSISIEVARTMPGKFAHLFFDGEESGCTVSRNVSIPFVDKIDMFIGLDRRGVDHVAIYGSENKYIKDTFTAFGGRVQHGSFTDCSMLARRFKKCCVNLSVGFMNEHTAQESWHPQGALFAISVLKKIEARQFKDQKPDAPYSYFGSYYGDYDGYYGNSWNRDMYKGYRAYFNSDSNRRNQYTNHYYSQNKYGSYTVEKNRRTSYRRNKGAVCSASVYDGWSDNDSHIVKKDKHNEVLALPAPEDYGDDVYKAHVWVKNQRTGKWEEQMSKKERRKVKHKNRARRENFMTDPYCEDWTGDWD